MTQTSLARPAATAPLVGGEVLLSGEWLLGEGGRYTRAYPATRLWPRDTRGNVLRLSRRISRSVAEVMVEDARAGAPGGVEHDDLLRWEGDVLVITDADGDEEERLLPDEEGRYEVPGWVWSEVEREHVEHVLWGRDTRGSILARARELDAVFAERLDAWLATQDI